MLSVACGPPLAFTSIALPGAIGCANALPPELDAQNSFEFGEHLLIGLGVTLFQGLYYRHRLIDLRGQVLLCQLRLHLVSAFDDG